MKLFVVLFLCSTLCSCASIRVVNRRPGKSGIIAVKNGFLGESAKVKAARAMRSNCRGPYRIVSEGEHKVGTTTKSRKTDSVFFNSENTTSRERDRNEWRLKYKCKRRR